MFRYVYVCVILLQFYSVFIRILKEKSIHITSWRTSTIPRLLSPSPRSPRPSSPKASHWVSMHSLIRLVVASMCSKMLLTSLTVLKLMLTSLRHPGLLSCLVPQALYPFLLPLLLDFVVEKLLFTIQKLLFLLLVGLPRMLLLCILNLATTSVFQYFTIKCILKCLPYKLQICLKCFM